MPDLAAVAGIIVDAATWTNPVTGAVVGSMSLNGELSVTSLNVTDTVAAPESFEPSNPTATASTTAVMMGLGSTLAFTPALSGNVEVTISGTWRTATAAVSGTLGGRYGTGTAPANAASATGTKFGTGSTDETIEAASASAGVPFSFTQLLSLTAGTAYWFDLATSTSAGGDVATITNVVATFAELPA